MRRLIQVVLYAQAAFLAFAAVVGFIAHQFPVAAQEQYLGRQVGFEVLSIAIAWLVISRLWQAEPRILLIPIVLNIVAVLFHGLDAVIVNAHLGLPAPAPSDFGDIYVPLVAQAVFLALFVVGYVSVRRTAQDRRAIISNPAGASG
jgi:hypothetical protein